VPKLHTTHFWFFVAWFLVIGQLKFIVFNKSHDKMPKQGGQGKGKPKKGDRDLGKALLRKQAQGYQGL
jgi:hypothetical protein